MITHLTSGFRARLIISAYQHWLKKGESALDIGCGTGIVSEALKKQFQLKITGCDLENYLHVLLPFKKLASDILPFKTKSYNVAMLNDVLHHMPKEKQAQLIFEAIRVSKKVLIFEFESTLIGKLADPLLNKLHYKNLDARLSLRKIRDWEKLFYEMGLKFQTTRVKKPFWYPFSPVAFMLTKN
ncbi:class I SAM-dependent methyltransferase [Candidatus Daviesbacteria bacterium]|nr:class I SAM-dependent methyltransferase [Candidatus Daviesbacteria bacterium]